MSQAIESNQSSDEESRAWLYSICPKNVAEATCGKAVLLTDAMIAQILDALKFSNAQTDVGRKALDDVWGKFMELWLKAPSIPIFDDDELVDEDDR